MSNLPQSESVYATDQGKMVIPMMFGIRAVQRRAELIRNISYEATIAKWKEDHHIQQKESAISERELKEENNQDNFEANLEENNQDNFEANLEENNQDNFEANLEENNQDNFEANLEPGLKVPSAPEAKKSVITFT
ncbi:hypothetical protein PO909_020945 [Leuciscus waleckii]